MSKGNARYTVHVNPAGAVIALTPGDPNNVTALPDDTVGQTMVDFDIVASGGTAPYTFTVGGVLPAGIQGMSDGVDTLRITGTPTESGDFAFDVTAVDAGGAQAQTTRFQHSVR